MTRALSSEQKGLSLQLVRLIDREQWAKRVLDALERNDYRRDKTAADIGISKRQLFRWLNEIHAMGIGEEGSQ